MLFLTTLSRKSSRLLLLAFVALLLALPSQVQAQWPPFVYRLTPTYADNKITYSIDFRSQLDVAMTDVTINIPIPEGTRFVEGTAQSSTAVTFNGSEVSFFTAVLPRDRISVASFTVEIIDPAQTKFTVHSWIAWKGDKAGDYLTEDFTFSTQDQQPTLDWKGETRVSLQLEIGAEVSGDTITYNIFPVNFRASRMWDLKINIPIPEGTTFVSAEAGSPFVHNFDGREVSFSIIEMPFRTRFDPLRVKVKTNASTPYPITTHAWATWKISHRRAGVTIASEEQLLTGEVIVKNPISQKLMADTAGDVPFSNYDLTDVAIQNDADSFTVIFNTAGHLCPADEVLEFTLFLDKDCRVDTGFRRNRGVEFNTQFMGNLSRIVGANIGSRNRGVEYEVRYRLDQKKGTLRTWDNEEQSWSRAQKITAYGVAGGKAVAIQVPYELIGGQQDFCWSARSLNRSTTLVPRPQADWAPDTNEFEAKAYESTLLATNIITGSAQTTGNFLSLADIATSDEVVSCEAEATTTAALPQISDINGKLAVPLYNDSNLYDVHVFSVPDGQEIAKIENARQPNIRFDGQKMLTNRMGGGIEDLYEYNFADGLQQQVGNGPQDSHPFYDKDGNRVVFGNAELTVGADGNRHPFIFVQCSLMPPYKETEVRCKNLAIFGVLVPAGQTGDLQGSNPVWTDDDRIAYKGCDTWAGSRHCGIYVVPSSSTKGFSDGFIPTRITDNTSDIPSDTTAGFVTFTSQRDGDWEAYVVNLDGSGLRNLSNSPTSRDGLPTISPDGGWVAFVSDRDGWWAVWATPLAGGEATKLFDLPDNTPWGVGADDWLLERISWGP